MPPHDPEIRIPFGDPLNGNLTYATTNTNMTPGTDTVTVDYNTVGFETNVTGTPVNDPLYRAYTTTTVPLQTYTIHGWDPQVHIDPNELHELRLDTEYLGHKVRIALEEVLDSYFRNIYKAIKEHVRFDISEDEFMKLIKGENNE